MIAILGSGFGLYGYLPALVTGCGQRVVLPERYTKPFAARPELARYQNNVRWERDEKTALRRAEAVIVALRPADQIHWARACLAFDNIKRIVLEKPLGPSPGRAAALFRAVASSPKLLRIGYTFRYTHWARQTWNALRSRRDAKSLSITWNFLAHHFRCNSQSWKQYNASGGGALRFYGIQVIALLAEIGYCDVIVSRSFGESAKAVEKWSAHLAGPGLPACEIVIDTRATAHMFRIELLGRAKAGYRTLFAELADPFEAAAERETLGLDRRVPVLTALCRSLWEESTDHHRWYAATLRLWAEIEKKNRFQSIGRHAKGDIT